MSVVKSIQVDITVKNAEASRAKLEAIDKKAEDMKKVFGDGFALKIDTAAAAEKLAVFKGELRDVAKNYKATVSVEVDKGSLARFRRTVSGLFGRGGGSAGGASGSGGLLAALPAASGLVNPYTIAAGAAASPFLAQGAAGATVLGFGTALAGMGVAGAFGLGASATPAQVAAAQNVQKAAQLRLLAAQQANARKSTPSSQASLLGAQNTAAAAQANLTTLQNDALTPGQLAVRKSFKTLSDDAQGSLSQIGKSFVPVMQSVLTTADGVLGKLTPVFAGAEKVIAGPFKVFSGTLIKSFATPAFTASIGAVAKSFGSLLTALSPQLGGDVAQVADGISRIARSVSDHPQAFADFVKGFFKVTGVALDGIAALSNFGGYLQQHFWPAMHRTSVIFDGVRHDIAHVWDQIWNNSIGMVIRVGHNVETQFNSFRHATANIFDGTRHDIAHYWDLIWNNTVGRVSRGIGDTVSWFKGMPGRITGAVGNLGTLLLQGGRNVISGFWSGLQGTWKTVSGWFAGLPSKILHALGIASPPKWSIDAGKHIMGGLLKGVAHGAADVKGFFTGIAKSVTGPFKGIWSGLASAGKDVWHFLFGGGGSGGGVQQWAGLVTQALKMERLPASLAPLVLYQMQTESGGNPNAQNNTDINAQMGMPSQGLMQVIPPTFAMWHWPGTSTNIRDPFANIAAAINYAAHGKGFGTGMGQIGSGHGYARGTSSAAPGWAWAGEGGVPELIRFRGGEQVGPVLAGGRNGGGEVHHHYHVTVDPAVAAVTPDRQLGRHIAEHLTVFIKGGGKLYPSGTKPA